jgi:PleD family two-component response regulator
MQTETKDAKGETPVARSTTFSILIVDDEVATRNLCRDVAADAGLQVYVAPTTEEALEILDQYPATSWSRICRCRNLEAWNC